MLKGVLVCFLLFSFSSQSPRCLGLQFEPRFSFWVTSVWLVGWLVLFPFRVHCCFERTLARIKGREALGRFLRYCYTTDDPQTSSFTPYACVISASEGQDAEAAYPGFRLRMSPEDPSAGGWAAAPKGEGPLKHSHMAADGPGCC